MRAGWHRKREGDTQGEQTEHDRSHTPAGIFPDPDSPTLTFDKVRSTYRVGEASKRRKPLQFRGGFQE